MHEFVGDLLIGGMRLDQVHGELEIEHPREDSSDWLLSGYLHVPEAQGRLLELDRQYRLQLADGRGANVFVSHIGQDDDELVISFEPECRPPRIKPR